MTDELTELWLHDACIAAHDGLAPRLAYPQHPPGPRVPCVRRRHGSPASVPTAAQPLTLLARRCGSGRVFAHVTPRSLL